MSQLCATVNVSSESLEDPIRHAFEFRETTVESYGCNGEGIDELGEEGSLGGRRAFDKEACTPTTPLSLPVPTSDGDCLPVTPTKHTRHMARKELNKVRDTSTGGSSSRLGSPPILMPAVGLLSDRPSTLSKPIDLPQAQRLGGQHRHNWWAISARRLPVPKFHPLNRALKATITKILTILYQLPRYSSADSSPSPPESLAVSAHCAFSSCSILVHRASAPALVQRRVYVARVSSASAMCHCCIASSKFGVRLCSRQSLLQNAPSIARPGSPGTLGELLRDPWAWYRFLPLILSAASSGDRAMPVLP
ncbi:hypothetical protein BJ912DRAFT_1147670 [Pholiota molesta]|nr:hypothetical protein BJ912DRAFT_1147670 [Pholiota molesta]